MADEYVNSNADFHTGSEFQKPLSEKASNNWDHIFGVDCPDCDNSGRLMPDGDQCQWCYVTPNSKFNKKRKEKP